MICAHTFRRFADDTAAVCVLEQGHLCAHAWGASAVAMPRGTVTWRHPDERPTLRDDQGRTLAVVEDWRP